MANKKPTYAGFQNSGYYNASNIAALQGLAGNYTTDRDALRAQAEAALRPTLDAQKLALNQQLENSLLSYNNQLSGSEQNFDIQRRGMNTQYNQSLSQGLNQLGKRGLQRSSAVGTTIGSIEGARNQALNDLGNKQTDFVNDLYNQIALARKQNGDSIAGLDSGYATQLDARVNELYNTNTAALTQLQLQLGQLQGSAYQQYVNQLNKQNKSSGGGSRMSSSGGTVPPPATTKPTYQYNNTQGGSGASGWFASGVR